MNVKKLSIIIPVFNEQDTIALILGKIKKVTVLSNIEKEIIIVNDCSTDNTGQEIEKFIMNNSSMNIHYHKNEVNKGKGASLQTGISLAKGEYLVIQDGDLEYDPDEYNYLLKPVVNGSADVVYGSRFIGGHPQRKLFYWHSIGNKLLTFMTNVFSNLNLTDMETCYKLFDTKIVQSITLVEKRFGFEPEVTIKISRVPNIRIYEVGISYYGRGYDEGKKIGWKDGFRALYCIIKYGLFRA
jgi:glycosyltransferase involved in cell wall biosynthesis